MKCRKQDACSDSGSFSPREKVGMRDEINLFSPYWLLEVALLPDSFGNGTLSRPDI
jgi:hypothetical protein